MRRDQPVQRHQPVSAPILESGVRVFESYHDSIFAMPASRHPYPELLYFRTGRGRIRIDVSQHHQTIICSPGQCVIVPSHAAHAIEDDHLCPLSLYGLAIDPTKISACAGMDTLLPIGLIPLQQVLLLDIENRLRRLLYLAAQPEPGSKLATVASAIDVFASLIELNQPRRPAENTTAGSNNSIAETDEITEYISWLDKHFFENVTLDAASAACGFSRRKFTQRFKDRTGKTWLQYVQGLRITHAKRLLDETESDVTSIAFQSGFAELSTFYRVFKRIAGQTPLDFRDRTEGNLARTDRQ
ncbi:MAG: AraC family transcriptional regulator [Planctomycetota bacterium]